MIMAPKNTFKYRVFSTDFDVYLCISLILSPCLSNLKQSSIFSRMSLHLSYIYYFLNNSFFLLLLYCFWANIFFVFLNTCNGYDNWSLSFVLLKLSFGKMKGTILYLLIPNGSFYNCNNLYQKL